MPMCCITQAAWRIGAGWLSVRGRVGQEERALTIWGADPMPRSMPEPAKCCASRGMIPRDAQRADSKRVMKR